MKSVLYYYLSIFIIIPIVSSQWATMIQYKYANSYSPACTDIMRISSFKLNVCYLTRTNVYFMFTFTPPTITVTKYSDACNTLISGSWSFETTCNAIGIQASLTGGPTLPFLNFYYQKFSVPAMTQNNCLTQIDDNAHITSIVSDSTHCPSEENGDPSNTKKNVFISGESHSLYMDLEATSCSTNSPTNYTTQCPKGSQTLRFNIMDPMLISNFYFIQSITDERWDSYNGSLTNSMNILYKSDFICNGVTICSNSLNCKMLKNESCIAKPIAYVDNMPDKYSFNITQGNPPSLEYLVVVRTRTANITITAIGGDDFNYVYVNDPVKLNFSLPYEESYTFIYNGLPGSTFNISTQIVNGAFIHFNDSMVTFFKLVVPPILLDYQFKSKTTALIRYSSDYGVPLETIYFIKIDGIPYPDCYGTALETCTLQGLTESRAYQITGFSENDGYRTKEVLLGSIDPSNPISTLINVTSRTTTALVRYNPGFNAIVYSIYMGESLISNTTFKSFNLENLLQNHTYTVKVLAFKNESSFLTLSNKFSTYPVVHSAKIYVYISSGNTSHITISSMDGVPGNTSYIVYKNNLLYINEDNSVISFTDEYRSDEIMDYVVVVKNDGVEINATLNLVYYTPPTISATYNQTTNSINIEWEKKNGGPGIDTYEITTIFQDQNRIYTLYSNTSFSLNNLAPNTTYHFVLSLRNYYFEPVFSYLDIKTSAENNILCKDPTCSGNGNCYLGTCRCNSGYNGINCQFKTTFIDPTILPDPITPTVNISFESNSYSFQFISISEFNSLGVIVKSLDFNILQWSLKTNTTNTINPVNIQPVKLNTWSYNLTNPDKLIVQSLRIHFIMVSQIGNSVNDVDYYPISFAGQNISLKYESLKYTIEIDNWNFKEKINTLKMSTKLLDNIPLDICSGSNSIDISDGHQTTIISIGNNKLQIFGRLIKIALIDSIPKSINYEIEENQSENILYTIIPYFETTAMLDPDFTLLIDVESESSCQSIGKKNNKWKIIVGAVVGSIVAAFIAIGIVILIKKKRFENTQKRQMDAKLRKMDNK